MCFKRPDQLGITDNYVFGEIMEKPEFCIPLLEAILDVEIDHIEVHHSEHKILPRLTGRGVRLDVYLSDSDGAAYDVEMQNASQQGFERRLGYYRSVLDVDAQERGTDYSDMKDVVVIFFTTFDPFDAKLKRYDCETVVQQTHARLRDGASIIVLNSKGESGTLSADVEAFLQYMEDANIQSNEYTRRVDAEVQRLCHDDDWYGAYMRYQLYVEEEVARARKRAIKEGREQGLAQGRAEGLSQGLAEGRAQGLSQGRAQGLSQGRAEGEEAARQRIGKLALALQEAGRQDELPAALTDADTTARLMAEFAIE